MNKLSVAKTIIGAYQFTFANLGPIIGLIWFPMVLSALLGFLPELSGAYGDSGPSAAAGSVGVQYLAVFLLTRLLYAVMDVAVARQALGLRQGPATFHFALGQQEFRVFGAWLLIYFSIGMIALLLGGAESAGGPAGAAADVVSIPAVLAVVYVVVRIAFLLVPSIVVENRIDFARNWILTKGNFWRIVAVWLAITVPLAIIDAGCMFALTRHEILAVLPRISSTANPQIAGQELAGLIDTLFRRHAPELMGVGLILAPFSLGLGLSASALAYRELARPTAGRRTITA